MRTIAIVGTSLAGLRAAETLRRDGFDERVYPRVRGVPGVQAAAPVVQTYVPWNVHEFILPLNDVPWPFPLR